MVVVYVVVYPGGHIGGVGQIVQVNPYGQVEVSVVYFPS